MNRNHIHDTLKIIYDQVFNEGRADLYPDLVAGPYIQHNPLVPDGVDGVMGFLKQAGRVRNEVKRIAIDGDLAFVHVRLARRRKLQGAVVFLASDDSSYVTGTELFVDGGFAQV